MDAQNLILTASTDYLIYLAISGGALVIGAIGMAFVGMKQENFPSGGLMRGLTALMVVLVVSTATLAVLTARDEQAVRRAENQEAAVEEQKATEENSQGEDNLTEGEAVEPDAGAGASGTPSDGGGETPTGDATLGAQVFVDNGCDGCHTLAAADSTASIGPDLDEVLPGDSDAMILNSIVNPSDEISEGFGDGIMPTNFGDLSQEELDGLVAYLQKSVGN